MTCQSKRVSKLRRKTNNALATWLDQQRTDPYIAQCLNYVIEHDGTVSFTETMRRYTLDEQYIEAAQCQDQIGFYNLILGRLAKHWKRLQTHHLSRTYPRKRYSADAWMKRLVYQLYKRMKTLWKNRCDIVHRTEGKAISKRERKALKKKLSNNMHWDCRDFVRMTVTS